MSKEKNDLLFEKLQEYFQDQDHFLIFKNTTSGKSCISLRLLDYFITSYAKQKDVCYPLKGDPFHVYNSYKSQLKAYSKKHLDPFCRRERTELLNRNCNESIITTIGQMNLFRWVIESNIIEYINANIHDIETTMKCELTNPHKRSRKKGKKEVQEHITDTPQTEKIFVVSF
tara:strand:+ start:1296 stop:1811 length:516 start_codon:yes stop_codon:yes gene_type:complete